MSEYIYLVDRIEPAGEEMAAHFRVETEDGEQAHLHIWEETVATNNNWKLGEWYELREIQYKDFGETTEIQAVSETKVKRIHSEEKISKVEQNEHSRNQNSQSETGIQADFTIAETHEWLQTDSKYSNQLKHTETIPAQDPRTSHVEILSKVQNALEWIGIDELYNHQLAALEAARDGSNLVLASDTASGKSVPYQIHALEEAFRNDSTTLYIAPYRALINDQADTFNQLINEMDLTSSLQAAKYHGDIPSWKKKRIRKSRPNILLMTPEQVHASLLGWHSQTWAWFWERLDTVVIDEIHEFRGTFGSHFSNVCRRLNRLSSQYGSDPTYFCCSATIGNPKEHASNITDKPPDNFVTVEEDTSGRGTRHWLLYNPPYKQTSTTESPGPDYPNNWGTIRKKVLARDNYTCTKCGVRGGRFAPVTFHVDHIIPVGRGGSHAETNLRTLCVDCHDKRSGHSVSTQKLGSAKTVQEVKQERERVSNRTIALRLFTELISRGHQTVVFEKTRQGVERYAEAATSKLSELTDEEVTGIIRPYHSHLPNNRRSEIEAGLQSGEIRGVWSTSALEVGVDIGGLDAVILSGHPGTTMELFQRAGRAGRGLDDCLVLFIASGNPLDQYCIANPQRIFGGSPGSATTNADNSEILNDHLVCAAKEHEILKDDISYPTPEYDESMKVLEEQRHLIQEQQGVHQAWQCNLSDPHSSVNLRGISDWEFELLVESSGVTIDNTLSLRDALRDCYPGAIYMNDGQKYQVTQFNQAEQQIHLDKYEGPEFTQSFPEEEITINEIIKERQPDTLQNVTIGLAEVTYKNDVYEYLFKEGRNDENPEKRRITQNLPTYKLNTEALYLTVPDTIRGRAAKMTSIDHPFLGGLHGIEHLLLSLFPLEILCEQEDISGLSQTSHPETNQGTIFLYDSIPGGIGLSRAGFSNTEALLRRAHDLVTDCGCKHGCPMCIHSPRCKVGNRALHKDLTVLTLEWMGAAETRKHI